MTLNTEEWIDEHGNPSFEYLQSLEADESPESLEKLRAMAEDLDVPYDSETPRETLIENIRSATRNDPNTIA